MVFGPAEEVPITEAQRMFETNFWGAARLVNAVLPAMRAQGGGRVVVVGSVAAGMFERGLRRRFGIEGMEATGSGTIPA